MLLAAETFILMDLKGIEGCQVKCERYIPESQDDIDDGEISINTIIYINFNFLVKNKNRNTNCSLYIKER